MCIHTYIGQLFYAFTCMPCTLAWCPRVLGEVLYTILYSAGLEARVCVLLFGVAFVPMHVRPREC